MAQDAMDARDADIKQPFDSIAHDLAGDGGFVGDGNVGCPSGDDGNCAAPANRLVAPYRDRTASVVEISSAGYLPSLPAAFAVRARDDEVGEPFEFLRRHA